MEALKWNFKLSVFIRVISMFQREQHKNLIFVSFFKVKMIKNNKRTRNLNNKDEIKSYTSSHWLNTMGRWEIIAIFIHTSNHLFFLLLISGNEFTSFVSTGFQLVCFHMTHVKDECNDSFHNTWPGSSVLLNKNRLLKFVYSFKITWRWNDIQRVIAQFI